MEYAGASSGSTQQYGTVVSVAFYVSTDGGRTFTAVGVDSSAAAGFSMDYVLPSAGELQFYTVATDDDGLAEVSPVYADVTVAVEADQTPPSTPVPAAGWPALLVTMVLLFCLYKRKVLS